STNPDERNDPPTTGGGRTRDSAPTRHSRVPRATGSVVVTMPLAPRVARTVDLAIGQRVEGPVLVNGAAGPLDRHAAGQIVVGRLRLPDEDVGRDVAHVWRRTSSGSKPVCVKCGLERAGAARRRRSYRCCLGPGVTVPKCRCSGIVPATLDSES